MAHTFLELCPSRADFQSPFQISSRQKLFRLFPRTIRARITSIRQKHIITCNYRGDRDYTPGSNPQRKRQRGKPMREQKAKFELVVKEYAVPAIGLLAAATLVGPFVGAIVVSAFGFAIAAAAVMAFSLSWLLIPGFILFFGIPMLMGGGMAAGIFAGAASLLVIPALLQLGFIAGSLWLGISIAKKLFSGDDYEEEGEMEAADQTIDVEARDVESMEREMEEEARRREQELKDFDDLLRRRERFQKGDRL